MHIGYNGISIIPETYHRQNQKTSKKFELNSGSN